MYIIMMVTGHYYFCKNTVIFNKVVIVLKSVFVCACWGGCCSYKTHLLLNRVIDCVISG